MSTSTSVVHCQPRFLYEQTISVSIHSSNERCDVCTCMYVGMCLIVIDDINCNACSNMQNARQDILKSVCQQSIEFIGAFYDFFDKLPFIIIIVTFMRTFVRRTNDTPAERTNDALLYAVSVYVCATNTCWEKNMPQTKTILKVCEIPAFRIFICFYMYEKCIPNTRYLYWSSPLGIGNTFSISSAKRKQHNESYVGYTLRVCNYSIQFHWINN